MHTRTSSPATPDRLTPQPPHNQDESLPHVKRSPSPPPSPQPQPGPVDPVLRNARREGIVIAVIWALTTGACCLLCGWLGFPAESSGPVPTFGGIPRWFCWGVLAPWAVCAVATWWFAGLFMVEDDLGTDHASELDSDIREEGGASHG